MSCSLAEHCGDDSGPIARRLLTVARWAPLVGLVTWLVWPIVEAVL